MIMPQNVFKADNTTIERRYQRRIIPYSLGICWIPRTLFSKIKLRGGVFTVGIELAKAELLI